MDVSCSIYSNNVTLEYLTNPLYQSELVKKHEPRTEVDNDDLKFYKKRVLAFTRELFRGNGPTEDLKNIHTEYVTSIIKYFKMLDTTDIIQNQYDGMSYDERTIPTTDFELEDVNMSLMRKKVENVTLDSFVIKNTTDAEPKTYPNKKKIYLKTENFKRKGIKKKKEKKM